jgi:anti-anti-sigma factor
MTMARKLGWRFDEVSAARLPVPPAQRSRLAVTFAGGEDRLTIRLSGDAGFTEAGTLEASLLPLGGRRLASVTFDLSEVRFISSLSLAVLLTYRRAAIRGGVRVRLRDHFQPVVRDTLETTGMIGLFELVSAGEPTMAASDPPLFAGLGI